MVKLVLKWHLDFHLSLFNKEIIGIRPHREKRASLSVLPINSHLQRDIGLTVSNDHPPSFTKYL